LVSAAATLGRRASRSGHDFGFKPGVDQDRLNQLADELDTEAAGRKLRS
jgi:hypothetical protein